MKALKSIRFWRTPSAAMSGDEVEAILDAIADHLFADLVRLLSEGQDTEHQEELANALTGDIQTWLREGIDRNLANDLVGYLRRNRLAERELKKLAADVHSIFVNRSETLSSVDDARIMGALCHALQSIVFRIPWEVYRNERSVPPEIAEQLTQALRQVESIRKRYAVSEKEEVLSFKMASLRLRREMARADGTAWIPLRPLVTAPLSARDELLELYARDRESESELSLARQVVAGDGVILITGYRGVGKSSFINLVIKEYIPKIEQEQPDMPPPWQVIPVYVSLAKVGKVRGVLRNCIRRLHAVLLDPDSGYGAWLRSDEVLMLRRAYLRASYKFSQQRQEAVSKSIESHATLELALGQHLASIANLPKPAFTGKIGRAWNRRLEQRIELLDYDENCAEEDLVQLIESLAEPRSLRDTRSTRTLWHRIGRIGQGEPADLLEKRLKLLFVFDEMDKMDEETGQLPLIRELKNLFLCRHAVFLLVTSKKFYYLWLEDRQQEDSILNSYFSSVFTVPLFTADKTARLVTNLALEDGHRRSSRGSGFTDRESLLVDTLARYLTYRAKGIPREIVRELQTRLHWMPGILQSYVTDETDQFAIMHLYAEIQETLEHIDQFEARPSVKAQAALDGDGRRQGDAVATELGEASPTLTGGTDVNSRSRVGGLSDPLSDSDGSESMIAPERLWFNKGRLEQIRHGRYVVVEELLNLGSLEWSPDILSADQSSPVKTIYEQNFQMVSQADYLMVLGDLATHLSDLMIRFAGNLAHLRRICDAESARPFEVEYTGSRGDAGRLVVTPIFYVLTGRPVPRVQSTGDRTRQRRGFEAISAELAQDGHFARRRALSWLADYDPTEIPARIQDQLYNHFVGSVDSKVRLEAGQLLTSGAFLERAARSAQSPDQLLGSITDEPWLRMLLQLVAQGARDSEAEDIVTGILTALLERGAQPQGDTASLPTDILVEIVSILVRVSDRDLVEVVAHNLNPDVPMPPALEASLLRLQKRSSQSLLELLVDQGINKLLDKTLRSLIEQESDLMRLWTTMRRKRSNPLAEKAMIEILAHLPREAWTTRPDPVLQWLAETRWSTIDHRILESAAEANPRVFGELDRLVPSSSVVAKQRLSAINPSGQPPVQQPGKSGAEQEKEPKDTEQEPKPMALPVALSALAMLGIYFLAVPFDLPESTTVLNRVIGRSLNFLYLPLTLIGLFLGFMSLDKELRDGGMIGIAILGVFGGAACILGLWLWQSFPITLLGQLEMAGVQFLVFAVPYGVGELTKRLRK